MAKGVISGINGTAVVSLRTTEGKEPEVCVNIGGAFFYMEPAEAALLADDIHRALAELAQAVEV